MDAHIPRHALRVATLAAWVLTGTGCAAVGAIADGLSDGGPPGQGGASGASHAPAGPSEPWMSGADFGDVVAALLGRGGTGPTRGAINVYVVSPALTWEALQLHRPYRIGGSSFTPGARHDPQCRLQSRLPFEVTGVRFSDPGTQLSFERPDGVPGPDAPVELPLSFDRDVMSERMMRSGAYLVERGPVCFESFFFGFSFGSGIGSPTVTSW